MNKKFSTLLASVLLAGGLTANAAIQDMTPGQYYYIAVGASNHSQNSYYLDSDAADWYVAAANLDNDGSSWWTVEQIKDPVTGNPIAYKLKNKLGKYYTVTNSADGKEYTAFAPQSALSGKVTITSDNTSTNPLSEYWSLLPYGTTGLYAHEGKLETTAANAWGFDNVKIKPQVQTLTDLKNILGNGFGLQICKEVIKSDGSVDTNAKPVEYSNLEGNVFTGVLVPVQGTNGVKLYQGSETGKQIVLTSDKWGSQGGGTTQEGYKFAAVTTKEYTTLKNNNKILAEEFVITQPATVSGEPLEVVATDGSNNYELVVTNAYSDNFTLTVSSAGAGDGEASYLYDKVAAVRQNTYVRFGVSNMIDYAVFYDKLLNITRTKVEGGAVESAAPECSSDWTPVAQVALDQPEGQWLYQGDYSFINRESGSVVLVQALRSTSTDNVYTDGEYNYTIAAVGTPGDTEDGYFAAYSADQLKQKSFIIGTPIASTGETVYMVSTGEKIAWTLDKTEAIQFRFFKVIFGNSDIDQIKHYTKYLGLNSKDEVIEKIDTLNFYRYNLAEVATGKTLGYDATNKVFVLGDAKAEESNTAWNAYSVVLKNKAVDLYNILTEIDGDVLTNIAKNVEFDFGKATANQWITNDDAFCGSANSAKKLYGAHNSNSLVQAQSAYNFVENDLFVIEDADANMYRPVATLDTIKIFRNIDDNYVLYETGALLEDETGAIEGFLGIQNFLDPAYAEKNAALLVDTAAGQGTWRPEYMLALDAKVVPAGKWCPIHGDDPTCPDAHKVETAGYVEGRYLVNLVDSATNGRTDCYYQQLSGIKYYRLGFVQAKHLGDSLIIASAVPAKADTINLEDNTIDKVCTFAFRYVDANRDAFRIETAYDVTRDADGDIESTDRGWIKYHNGIPVVTNEVSDAEVFDLEVLQGVAPTANDEVAVSEVSVVATNGAVIVKGAAGKKVAISNILGQTVANTVISSDNATIAAPAGIVVVAVEGEDAVKVVVK